MPRPFGSVIIGLELDPRAQLDAAARADMARALERQLAALDGVEAKPAATAAPAGAKGIVEGLTMGALVLAVAPGAVQQLLAMVKEWVGRPGAAPVKLAVQDGEKRIEVEFDPTRTAPDAVEAFVGRLQAKLKGS